MGGAFRFLMAGLVGVILGLVSWSESGPSLSHGGPDAVPVRVDSNGFHTDLVMARAPLIARGELFPMSATLFFSQIVGPAQVFCRAWLSGRERSDPRAQADTLIACAIRALLVSDNGDKK